MPDTAITPSTRIYGAALILKIDGTDYAGDITEWELEFEEMDKDSITFAEVSAGAADKGKLKVTAIQSTDPTSLWRILWNFAGKKNVAFVIAPHGNKTAEATKPHLTGTLDIGLRPKAGGAADPKKAYLFEAEFECQVDKALKVS